MWLLPERGGGVWGRHFCFSFCISYNKNITKKGRKKKHRQVWEMSPLGTKVEDRFQVTPDSVLLEPDLNLCSEWCGQERRGSGGEGRGGLGTGGVGERAGSHLTGHPVLRTGCVRRCRETPRTRGKSGVRALPINVLPTP